MRVRGSYLAKKPSPRRVIAIGSTIILMFLFAFLCTPGLAFETEVEEGLVIISGKATPDELQKFAASFQMQLPVEAGQYQYETSISVPQKPNRFTVKVQNVQDLNVGVKIGIWLTKRFKASGGMATLSQSNIPPGKYNLKIFGQALEGSSSVSVEATAHTEAKADERGDYRLIIDTAGIPGGEYTIRGAGQTKIIRIDGPCSPVATASQASSVRAAPQPSSPTEITGEVLDWYAGSIGKDTSNATQLAETERLLKNRLKGGYWKVISQGEALTEEAGNCLQRYCLVRGSGACSSCRQKDQILKNSMNRSSAFSNQSNPRNETNSPKPESQTENLISRLLNWLIDSF